MSTRPVRIEWDPRSESVAARGERRLGDLVIAEEPLRGAVPGATAAMIAGIRALGLGGLRGRRQPRGPDGRTSDGRQQ